MKRSIFPAVAIVALAASVVVSTATAADPLVRKVNALQRQVTTQQREINALTTAVKALRTQVASSGDSTLTVQVSSLQTTVSGLQTQVNGINAMLTCRVAQFATFNFGVLDIFALMIGDTPQFTGQVVSDDGACAQVGLTPPSPAPDRYVDPGSPKSVDLALDAELLSFTRG